MRILIVILYLSFSLNSVSQNLVRNWSFEDTISCPTMSAQVNKAEFWFTPRGGGGPLSFLVLVIILYFLHLDLSALLAMELVIKFLD